MLALLGRQLTHEEIGHRLFISVRTVESHVASLRRKLDLPDHRSLVRYAVVHADGAGSSRLGMRASAPLTSFVGRGEELPRCRRRPRRPCRDCDRSREASARPAWRGRR